MHKRTSDDGAADDDPHADSRKRVSTVADDDDDRPLAVLAALAADPESRMSGLWRDVRQHVLAPMLVPTLATGKYTRVRRIQIPSMVEMDNRSFAHHGALGHSHYFFALTDCNVLAVSRADPSVVCWYWVDPHMHCGLAALPDGGVAVLDQDGVIYLCPPPRADGAAAMSIRDPERREHWAFFMAPFGGLQATKYDVPLIRTGTKCHQSATKFAASPDGTTFWIGTNDTVSRYHPCTLTGDDGRRVAVRVYDRSGALLRTLEYESAEMSGGLVVTDRDVCVSTRDGRRVVVQPLAPGASTASIYTKTGHIGADGCGNLVVWGCQPYLDANAVYDTASGAHVRSIWYPTGALPQTSYPFTHYDRVTGSLFSLHVEGRERGTIYELY